MTGLRRPTVVLLVAALLLIATACRADEADSPTVTEPAGPVDQTITVVMDDFEFKPETVTVRAGTTVRFRFRNEGATIHDAAIGDEAFQKAVADGKAKRDGPEVGPNNSKDYVKTFSAPAQLIIGCHQPGHYQQGMLARLTVT